MSNKSTTESVSVGPHNAADVNKRRPAVDLRHLSDVMYAETMSVVGSNGSEIETSEQSYAPFAIEEFREKYEEEKEKEEEEGKAEEKEEEEEEEEEEEKEEEEDEEEEEEENEEEDIQDVCDKEEEQGFSQLYLAVEYGDTEGVRELLMSSVDVNALDINKNNRSQLYASVKRLLNKNASVDPRNAFDRTSLRKGSENGHPGTTHALVKSNADVLYIRSGSCNVPPLVAAEMGYAEIIKALTDHDGEINAVDENGETLLHLAAKNDLNAVVDVLLDQSAERNARTQLKNADNQVNPAELGLSQHAIKNKVDSGKTPQPIATQGGNFEVTETPLSRYSSVKKVSTVQEKPPCDQLTARLGHAEIVENLILKGANVNARNSAQMTPLHLACQYGHSSIVDILLDNHATVDVSKHAREQPFYLAAENGHADVVDVLLRRGICDFVTIRWNETPLHVAVTHRHTNVVEVILKHSCKISGKLTKDEQKLQHNAKNLVETTGIMPIELMKRDGRRISAGIVWTEKSTPIELMIDSVVDTALKTAIKSTQPKMVKILLSLDPCAYSEKHLRNSFYCMIKTIRLPGNKYEVMSKMKRRNINDIMEVVCYDIQYKMKCKNIKEIAHVLVNSSKFNVNHQDDELNNLLHEVIKQCGECVYDLLTKKSKPRLLLMQTIDDVIQLLLEKGADFNMKNAFGETPLITAAVKGCSHAIKTLFAWEQKSEIKLDVDARDQYGATALFKAAETHHVSVMRLLLNHKVSVNLHDYYGFTALHAAVYEPNRNFFDLHFFCNRLLKTKFDYLEDYFEISRWRQTKRGEENVKPCHTIDCLKEKLENGKNTTRFKEEMVTLLLAADETNVNAIDFRGNTPLDLAVKSSERNTLETFRALKDRGAIRNLLKPEDEAPMEEARVDESGRLIISHISHYAVKDMKAGKRELDHDRFDLMVDEILLKRKKFWRSATATDDKGRTPLHYVVMPPSYLRKQDRDVVRVLLEIGSNVNVADMYGKTPLHYAEMDDQYKLLIQYGADESIKDKYGYTPRDLRQLRESVTINTDNADKLSIGKKWLYMSRDIARVLNTNHVTELSKRKLYETVRIYSQSSRPEESSEDAIWKFWNQNEFFILNRRVSHLKPSIQRLIERLADGIKEKDSRFECQPILVGSADEETKSIISADFDFNFRLTKFSQLCDVFPHPLGPKGYFQLRRARDNIKSRQCDGEFDCFFNLDQCLLTDEVNTRFQIVLEDILNDPNFWRHEDLFEWHLTYKDEQILQYYEKPAGLCKTVRLRMIHPIADGEGGFLFLDVSIDIVACVHAEDLWLGNQLPVAISSSGKADGCTLVFDRPRFDPSKPIGAHFDFSDTFARISFAPLESRTIRESSSLIKAAYIVCKLILYYYPKTTYQLKTSLLYCIEALKVQEGSERKDEEKVTQEELAFWVERIMFCFMEFYRHDVYPCYFMPTFRRQAAQLSVHSLGHDGDKEEDFPFQYSATCDMYLDLCPDDTEVDIAIFRQKYTEDINANQDQNWEPFDREEFITKLSSRCSR